VGKIYTLALRKDIFLDTDVLLPQSSPPPTVNLNEHINNKHIEGAYEWWIFLTSADPVRLLKTGTPEPSFPKTCLGGTFDRLHAGHKILLTKAVLNTTKSLLIGISSMYLCSCLLMI
jgi:hypothetical protein